MSSLPKQNGNVSLSCLRSGVGYVSNEHGFWLDGGEEKRVLGIMKQRIKDIKRSSSAEEEWAGILKSFKSKSFLDKFRGMFRG